MEIGFLVITSTTWLITCRLPGYRWMPGNVTSTSSATSLDARATAARASCLAASAFSSASRTSFETLPACGRSSRESAPSPRSTLVSEPFLPRYSIRTASMVSRSPAASTAWSASIRNACNSSTIPMHALLTVSENEKGSRSRPGCIQGRDRLPRYHPGWRTVRARSCEHPLCPPSARPDCPVSVGTGSPTLACACSGRGCWSEPPGALPWTLPVSGVLPWWAARVPNASPSSPNVCDWWLSIAHQLSISTNTRTARPAGKTNAATPRILVLSTGSRSAAGLASPRVTTLPSGRIVLTR